MSVVFFDEPEGEGEKTELKGITPFEPMTEPIEMEIERAILMIQALLVKAAQEVPVAKVEFEAAVGKLNEALALIVRAKRKVEAQK